MNSRMIRLALAGALLSSVPAVACTGFYVGKDVSADGMVLLGRTVDHGAMATSFRQVVVPRVENRPGRILTGTCGFSWPLPATTWKYVATPAVTAEGIGDFSSAVANEKGLVMTATVTGHLGSQTTSVFKMAPHGCAEDNITPLVAASCANVKEALDLIGEVMAKNGTREPNIYMLADQRESWLVETYVTNLWAAMRLPTDRVMAFGNHFVLEGYDPSSPDWRAAPEIESAARKAGIAVYTDEGRLHLYRTYDGVRTYAPNIRSYHAHRLLAPGTEGTYSDRLELPQPFVPSRKVGIRDLLALMRTRYEGTAWCPEEQSRTDVRVIGDESQATCHVIALRDDLPADRAATVWSCLGPAEHSLFLPLGNAITRTQEAFAADETNLVRNAFYPDRLAGDAFYALISLAQTDRELYGRGVRDFWARREDELFAAWPKVWQSGDAAAQTDFVVCEQARALDDVRRLTREILFRMSKNSRTWRWLPIGGRPTYIPRQAFESSDLKAAREAPGLTDPTTVLPSEAPSAVRLAAAEFAKYWKSVTGRALPTNGAPRQVAFALDPTLDCAHDEYRLVSTTNGLSVTGANGRAVLYAVYDFFARQAGCRWYWDGDRVPTRDTVDLTGLDVREKAATAARAIGYPAGQGLSRFRAEHWTIGDWQKEIDWALKSRVSRLDLAFRLDGSCYWRPSDRADLKAKVLAYAAEREIVLTEEAEVGTETGRVLNCHADAWRTWGAVAAAWGGSAASASLEDFCRDRYGDRRAAAFAEIWRKALPLLDLAVRNGGWGADLTSGSESVPPTEAEQERTDVVPEILGGLAELDPTDDFQRRDAVDLARLATDCALPILRRRMLAAYADWVAGAPSSREARRLALAYRKLAAAATELLAWHTDYSVCYTYDRLSGVLPVTMPEAERVLLAQTINGPGRGPQYEIAAGWYLPLAEDLCDEILRRLTAGERKAIESAFVAARTATRRRALVTAGIEAFRPQTPLNARTYRRILGDAREAAAR